MQSIESVVGEVNPTKAIRELLNIPHGIVFILFSIAKEDKQRSRMATLKDLKEGKKESRRIGL